MPALFRPSSIALLAYAVLVVLALAMPARAVVVCDASALCAAGADPCEITTTVDVVNGCTLDFGTRTVVVKSTMRAQQSGGSFALRAGALTVHGGTLQARGTNLDFGGDLDLRVTGTFLMTGAGPRLNVDGQAGGGTIFVQAGTIDVAAGAPAMTATGTTGEGAGGDITLFASGPVRIAGALDVGSGLLESGGTVDIVGASVQLERQIVATGGGSDGGTVTIAAEAGDVVMTSTSSIVADGGAVLDFAGSGGTIEISAAGNATLRTLKAVGVAPDGSGGTIELSVDGDVDLLGTLNLPGNGLDSGGGYVQAEVGGELTVSTEIDVHGGNAGFGGDVFLDVGQRLTIPAGGVIRATGGYIGGGVTTFPSPAAVVLDGDLLVRGSRGGSIDIGPHCSIAVGGLLDASGTPSGWGGSTTLVASSLTVAGGAKLLALECLSANCGENRLVSRVAPVIAPAAVVNPAPVIEIDASMNACCGNAQLDAGEACDDGNRNHCDGCDARCAVEPSPVCPPNPSECVAVACVPSQGCVTTPRTGQPCTGDGNACTADVCQGSVCAHPPASCSDGIACTVETCDVLTGCASTPVDAACDDGNPCTVEHCDPVAGCVVEPLPDQSPCSDGSVCTVGDVCQGGQCVAPGPPLACDDGDPCTDDTCDPLVGCRYLENPAACPCSSGGVPADAGTRCVDGDGCTVGETCNGAGACTGAAPLDCNDGDGCTADACGSGVCVHMDNLCPTSCTGQANGTPCSDGRPCTRGTCQAGACVGTPVTCGDGAPCTGPSLCIDAPYPIGCRDSVAPDGTACEDGDACTAGDTCSDGVCQPGTGSACGPCETCGGAAGCVPAPRTACIQSAKPTLRLKNRTPDGGDQLLWRWVRGGATTADDFGDPLAGDGQALCVFDGAGGLVFGLEAPAGGTCLGAPCWKPLGDVGFKYTDKEGTPSGIEKLFEKAGADGKSRIIVKARGENLGMPAITPELPLTVQLHTAGACFEARHEPDAVSSSSALGATGK